VQKDAAFIVGIFFAAVICIQDIASREMLCRAIASRRFLPAIGQRSPTIVRSFGSGGDPRAHLNPDGTRPEQEDGEGYHDPDPSDYNPKPLLIKERGQTWVKSQDPPKSAHELYGLSQENVPFWPRHRLYLWGNYRLIMKAEYLFFYIPTVIIFGLGIPAFTSIYLADELVNASMTIKVTGRQWYWVYEVESPTEEEEEE
jgi:hypothetical protein